MPAVEDDPAGQNRPAAALQFRLSLAEPTQKCPTGQSEPAADDDPSAQKLPAAVVHEEQDEAPEDAKLPAEHFCLLPVPPTQKCPRGQSEPAADDDPAAQ